MDDIFKEIADEVTRQDKKWGGLAHDEEHTIADWIAIMTKRLGLLFDANEKGSDAYVRHRLVQVAAVAVAAIRANS